MLKIDTSDHDKCVVEMKGSIIEITAELATVVQNIYDSISKDNHMAGLIFLKDFMHYMEKIADNIVNEAEERQKKSMDDPMSLLAFMSLLKAMQADKRHEKKDIRSADFDDDEEFRKWFHGGDEE